MDVPICSELDLNGRDRLCAELGLALRHGLRQCLGPTNWVSQRVPVLDAPQRGEGRPDGGGNLGCRKLATIEHWEPEGSLLTRFCLLHGKRRVCFAVQSLGLLFRRSLVQVDLVVGARALRLVRPKTKGSRLSGPLARPLLR